MQTFVEFRPMVVDPSYNDRRKKYLNELNIDELDAPIAGLIDDLRRVPFCFTIQSCFGHFLYSGQTDLNDVEPLPSTSTIQSVEYRIAYIAICLENNHSGREFLHILKQLPELDHQYIQFGCAEWFWERNQNSYVLQIESAEGRFKDSCTIDFEEARHIETVRNKFYNRLMALVSKINEHSASI